MLAFVIFASGGNDIDQRIAYLFVIVNIPLINIKWFFSSINQFTKKFVIDSYLTITQKVFKCCSSRMYYSISSVHIFKYFNIHNNNEFCMYEFVYISK